MIGPNNKQLGHDFLKVFLNHINSIDIDEYPKCKSMNLTSCDFKFNSKKFYKYFLEKYNFIIYNNNDICDEFRINDIYILDKEFNQKIYTSYKDKWNDCDLYHTKYIPSYCPYCDKWGEEESETSEEEDNNTYTFLTINQLKNINIEYTNNISSYPNKMNWVGGRQFDFVMCFKYNQPNLHIYLELGTKRNIITNKKILDHSTNPKFEVINQLVYDYRPSNLYFDNELYNVIKQTLIHYDKNKIIKLYYKNIQYQLIDIKYTKTFNNDFSCGCGFNQCFSVDDINTIINLLPEKHYYGTIVSISCTPEWYIQIQIGACENYCDFCLRIILEPL